MNHFLRSVLAFVTIFVLAACGGSDSGGGGTPNVAPTAVAAAAPLSGAAPLSVNFSGSGSSDSDGSISSYSWSFGDGGSGSGSTPSHSYTTPGTYVATLTVTDNDGATATDTVTITVLAEPTAAFTASPTSGDAPLNVDFDASSSSDSDGSIVFFAWDFGDGATGSGVTTSHTFNTAGTYTVALTVTDDDGLGDTDSINVTVTAPSFSVSGSIQVASNHVVDTDVNDPYAGYASNDLVGEEQALPNPAIVGGFASKVGTGGGPVGDDRFADVGDEQDLYYLQLVAGQQVSLSIAAWDVSAPYTHDLDLCIYDFETLVNIACSAGVNNLETISITDQMITDSTSGTFIIQVYAYAGISNYTLTVGAATAPTSTSNLSLYAARNFVPGEVIVKLRQGAGNGGYMKASSLSQVGPIARKAGAPGRAMLYSIPRDSVLVGQKASAATDGGRTIYQTTDADSRYRLDTIALVKALWQDADVEAAGLNHIHQPLATPNDPGYSRQWHYRQINLEQAWDVTTGSSGNTVVAVIDTGVFLAHEDLAANMVGGYDFISYTSISNDGDGIDSNPDDPGDEATPGSSSWHGTHVAGTIGAVTDNSIGVAGIAWGAKLMPIRVLGIGGGTSYDIIQGVRYAAGLPNDSGTVPPDPADVLNLSLGCQNCYNSAIASEYQAARDAGAIIVAAAGNANTSVPGYPASYTSVISVSSVRPDKQRAYYSNYGQYVAIAAPGGETAVSQEDGVLSTLVDDWSGPRASDYKYYQGTSMASPHVAGVIALMHDVHPGITPDDVDSLIASGAISEDIGSAGRDDYFGYGLIDARKAVEAALDLAGGGAPLPTVLTVNPSQVFLGQVQETTEVLLSISGDGSLTVNGYTDNASWLSVSPVSVDGSGLGSYLIQVDRTGLPTSSYQGRVTFTADNGSSVYVVVNMTSGSSVVAGDAGLTYVLLVDNATNETVHQDEVFSSGGSYSYSFTGVAAGNYRLLAGTDMDNDYFICDSGEGCGGYPVLADMEDLVVDSDLVNMDFLLNFDLRIINSSSTEADEESSGFKRQR